MAKLSPKKRESLPKSDFGLPGSRSYPMPDAKADKVLKQKRK